MYINAERTRSGIPVYSSLRFSSCHLVIISSMYNHTLLPTPECTCDFIYKIV